MKKIITSMVLFVAFSVGAFAMVGEPDHSFILPQDIVWMDAPASLPPGAKAAVLFGDMTAAAPFSVRLKLPANYRIPMHFHPADENVTVISGTFMMGMQDKEKSMIVRLPAGSFARMLAGTPHFAQTGEEVIVQINGVGPWGITYVNPEDDPRK